MILLYTGGLDFDVIRDRHLTFSPDVSLHRVSINISSDGHFEETEYFSVALSTRIMRLQLNSDLISLKNAICQEEDGINLFSVTNDTADRDQARNIPLDRVILTQEMGEVKFSLISNESDRVSVSPAETRVTIMDNDGKHNLIQLKMFSVKP